MISQGSAQHDIYFLMSGSLRCYDVSKDGHELTNNFVIIPGSPFIAAASLDENDSAVDNIQAMEPSKVVTVPLNIIKSAEAQLPIINKVLAQAFGKSLSQYLTITKVRSLSVMERYRWLQKKHPELVSRIQKQYLASFLDMDKAVYSRCARQTE